MYHYFFYIILDTESLIMTNSQCKFSATPGWKHWPIITGPLWIITCSLYINTGPLYISPWQVWLRGTMKSADDLGIINSSPPGQNGRHFADDMFKCIFLNENIWISNEISLKYIPRGLIDNMSALVQIMAWHHPGDKPLSEPMLTQFPDAYMRH